MTAIPRPRFSPEDLGSAGTAGRGFRCQPEPHAWTPEPPEHGRRPVCAICQRDQHSETRTK